MPQLIATALDTAGIQSYIFDSNRLRENIGASYLVAQATETWAKEALDTLKEETGKAVVREPVGSESWAPVIQTGKAIAELIYAGGGNTTLLFTEKDYAIRFTQILSRKILEAAPGIQLIAAHRKFNWETDDLQDIFQTLIDTDLTAKKQLRSPSVPLLGLSVTADCQSTQLVAMDYSHHSKYRMPKDDDTDEGYRISRNIAEKLKSVKPANDHLKQTLFKDTLGDYNIPRDFDDFGRAKGDISYIAVVHADGNNMGDRFKAYGKENGKTNGKTNADYIIAVRRLSDSVNQAGINALKTVAQNLVGAVQPTDNGPAIITRHGNLTLNKAFLPFRPLVYGGDDVTFVCDGRLGLSLAADYLQAFEAQPAADGQPLRACAGVSIVKVHYPFARAYELSESLCQEAKRFVREETDSNPAKSFCAMDWHIAGSGLLGDLSTIRKTEYTVAAEEPGDKPRDLTMRPVRLQPQKNKWRTWEGFTTVVNAFQEHEDWSERRNKIFALRKTLRKGTDAIANFLTIYRLKKLPTYPKSVGLQADDLSETGWIGKRCGYFDAIEALDFYAPLTLAKSAKQNQTISDTSEQANHDTL
ncbi:MAG: hypothetical protein AAFV85_20940 [Cyanobacteria bacterium J06634_6]